MIDIEDPAAARQPSAAAPHLERAPLAVYLRNAEGEPLDGALGWLAQRFGLDTFSTSLLGHRGRLEMKAAALVLLVVFLFDLVAWSLLFNTILHNELLAVDALSIAALLAGLLFSSMVVLYERQFLTTDVTMGWRRLALPTAIRFVVILSSAFVTAQPVELLFFRQPVLIRSHQEGIRLQVATRRDQLRKLEGLLEEKRQELANLPQMLQGEPEHVDLLTAQGGLATAIGTRDDLEVQRAQAVRNAAFWKDSEAARRRARDAARLAWQTASSPFSAAGEDAVRRTKEALDRAEAAYRAAVGERQRWSDLAARRTADLAVANGQVDRSQTLVDHRQTDFLKLRDIRRGRIEQGASELRAEEERLQRWVRRLRELTPAELRQPINESLSAADRARTFFGAPTAFPYQVPAYDFFEQLRVLGDLRRGAPPLWSGVPTSAAAQLAEVFSLADPVPCEDAARARAGGCDAQRWQRHLAATAVYRYSYYVVYAIALVIPLMVFATKLLMAPELKTYYSAAAQARAGNPEALRLQAIASPPGPSC